MMDRLEGVAPLAGWLADPIVERRPAARAIREATRAVLGVPSSAGPRFATLWIPGLRVGSVNRWVTGLLF